MASRFDRGASPSRFNATGEWYCASAADYPVEWDRIRKLLVQLDQLERWEAKTQDPTRHAAVDLDTSIQEGQAIEIELFADSDLVSHVVLGKQQWSPKSTFARLATEDQTFKCKGHVEVELNPVAWLDTTFCTLERSGITQMNFGPMELVRRMIHLRVVSQLGKFRQRIWNPFPTKPCSWPRLISQAGRLVSPSKMCFLAINTSGPVIPL